MAVAQVEGGLAGLAAGLLVMVTSGSLVAGVALGTGLGLLTSFLKRSEVATRRRERLRTIRRRLPFAVDLLALLMEAGTSFQEALTAVVSEMEGTALGEELATVLRDIGLGRTRKDALDAFQDRLRDGEISEIVFAVNKAEELGTPLSQILKTQAQQLRLKRSQWVEKAAAEAQVKIVFPGMVTMVACLLIVLAPFVLQAYYSF
jgi:tight adherence protein C